MTESESLMPKDLLEIIKEVTLSHLKDVERAVRESLAKIRKRKEYPGWIDRLVERAVRRTVHECRHVHNRAIKRDAGDYTRPTNRTAPGGSRMAVAAYHSAYDLVISSFVVGEMTREEGLEALATERAMVTGHQTNVNFLASLFEGRKPRVRQGSRVKDVVSEPELRKLLRNAGADLGKLGLDDGNGRRRKSA